MLAITDKLTFGELLRRLRRAKGWQGRQAAAALGISGPRLSRLENEYPGKPSPEFVLRVAELYEIDPVPLLRAAACLPPGVLALLPGEETTP